MKVDLKKVKTITKKYHGQIFEINPYVSLSSKEIILTSAYTEYLSRIEESGGLIEAITGVDADIQMMILGSCVSGLEFEEGATYDDLLTSGFLYFVLDEVINYRDIRDSAHDLIRLFVISERIPDINEMANIIPSGALNMDKENVELMTDVIKNIE